MLRFLKRSYKLPAGALADLGGPSGLMGLSARGGMTVEAVSPHEAFGAQAALVRFNARVDLHVAHQVMLHFEALATNGATEWPQTQMHAHVPVPLAFVRETFATLARIELVNP